MAPRAADTIDYRLVVYAPASVQDPSTSWGVAFDTADRNRNPVMILADVMICQMMVARDSILKCPITN
jgi:pyruvate/2-oxoacid:ferredoxin oxidoreductase alpha subunit